MLCTKKDKVLAPKETKNAFEVDQGVTEANLTVITPSMITSPYKRIQENITATIPDNWSIGTSDNRWMQPVDVAYFKPLKMRWKQAVLEWKRHNPLVQLNKDFAPILEKAI